MLVATKDVYIWLTMAKSYRLGSGFAVRSAQEAAIVFK